MPRYGTVHLSVTKQKLDSAQIPGAPVSLEEHASCKATSGFFGRNQV